MPRRRSNLCRGLNRPANPTIITSFTRQEGAVKSFREYYKECFEAETPKFIKVMKAVPADQAGYRPHPRSTSAGDLVWLLASELHDACQLLDRGEIAFV